MEPNQINIFVSYSHNNSSWLDRDKYNLIPFLEDSLKGIHCKFWYDYDLKTFPGAKYEQKIIAEIINSDIVVLLISVCL